MLVRDYLTSGKTRVFRRSNCASTWSVRIVAGLASSRYFLRRGNAVEALLCDLGRGDQVFRTPQQKYRNGGTAELVGPRLMPSPLRPTNWMYENSSPLHSLPRPLVSHTAVPAPTGFGRGVDVFAS
jgi:hypothetical protein